jgi:hypothetical protein
MPEPTPTVDPVHYVRIPVRYSAWCRIKQEAEAARREATEHAALILERHAARKKSVPQAA